MRRTILRGPVFATVVALAALSISPARGQSAFEAILERTRAYVLNYEDQFSGLVAEEEYEQEARAPRAGATYSSRGGRQEGIVLLRESRKLRSNFLLVRTGETGFVPFRDVFEVDGVAVRDRADRLRRLFEKPSPTSWQQAERLTQESARYNLPDIVRTVNVPTFALRFLHPSNRDRFTFSDGGSVRLDGRMTTAIDFVEVARPTIVRTAGNLDLPSSGRIWIDQASGSIWQTRHLTRAENLESSITVKFSDALHVGLPVPIRADESYSASNPISLVRCTAKYANYQRVSILTQSAPKP